MRTRGTQLFRCLRCLLLQTSPGRLAPLWPTVLTELAHIVPSIKAGMDAELASARADAERDAGASGSAGATATATATATASGTASGTGGVLGVGSLPGALVAAADAVASVASNVASAVVAPVVSLVNEPAASRAAAPPSPAQAYAVCRFLDWALCIAPDDVQLYVWMGRESMGFPRG